MGRAWHDSRHRRSQPAPLHPTLPCPATSSLHCATQEHRSPPKPHPCVTGAHREKWQEVDRQEVGQRPQLRGNKWGGHDRCGAWRATLRNSEGRRRRGVNATPVSATEWSGLFHRSVWETLSGVTMLLDYLLAPVMTTVGGSWSWPFWQRDAGSVCLCDCYFLVCLSYSCVDSKEGSRDSAGYTAQTHTDTHSIRQSKSLTTGAYGVLPHYRNVPPQERHDTQTHTGINTHMGALLLDGCHVCPLQSICWGQGDPWQYTVLIIEAACNSKACVKLIRHMRAHRQDKMIKADSEMGYV